MANLKILTFKIRDKHFALPSVNIKEIAEAGESLKDVFYDRGGMLKGLMNYEGEMISVLDTPVLLDVEKAPDKEYEEPLVLVCRDKTIERAIGITISSIVAMEIIDDTLLKHSQDEEASYTHGFLREGKGDSERVVTIIDLKKFFDYAENKILRHEGSATEIT